MTSSIYASRSLSPSRSISSISRNSLGCSCLNATSSSAPLSHPMPMRLASGGVYFRRLERNALSAFLGEVVKRQRVVESVGEFDDDDANILRHGDQHLAVAFRLADLRIRNVDFRELRDAVHEFGDVFSEMLVNFPERRGGILHGVVKKPAHTVSGSCATPPEAGPPPMDGICRARREMRDCPLMYLRREDIGFGEQVRAVGRVFLDQIDDVHDPGGRTWRQNWRQRISSSSTCSAQWRKRAKPGSFDGYRAFIQKKRYLSTHIASRSSLKKKAPPIPGESSSNLSRLNTREAAR